MTFPVAPSKGAPDVTHTGGANAVFYIKLKQALGGKLLVSVREAN